jgi:hypothetical protein
MCSSNLTKDFCRDAVFCVSACLFSFPCHWFKCWIWQPATVLLEYLWRLTHYYSQVRILEMEGKGKVHPRTGHEGPKGEYRYSITLSLTSALDSNGWSTPRPGCFISGGKKAGTHYTGRWMGLSSGLDVYGKSRPPLGFDPRKVQPIASRWSNCAIPVHKGTRCTKTKPCQTSSIVYNSQNEEFCHFF